jgi:hypothetical protein
VSGTPDQISDDEDPIPRLHVTSTLSFLSMLLLPRRLTVMMKFPFRVSHTALLWFRVMVMLRFLSCAPVFLAFPPPPPLLLFAPNLPCRLAATADALSGMDNSNLLLLLLLPVANLQRLHKFWPLNCACNVSSSKLKCQYICLVQAYIYLWI